MTQDLIATLGYLAIGSRMRRITDLMWRDVSSLYERRGIEFEPRWFPVYYLLCEGESRTISEIARELNYSHPAVVQIANAMQKKGLIESSVHEGDRRTRALSLTRKGRDLRKRIEPVWEEIRLAVEDICLSASAEVLPILSRLEAANEEEPLLERVERIRRQKLDTEIHIIPFERGNKKHAKAFLRLNEEWLQKYFVVEPHDREMLGNPEGFILTPGGEIFFAVWGDEIVGTCAMIAAPDNEFELAKMAVTERAQGKQIGKRLGQTCLEWAKSKHAKAVWLESNSRLTTALNLYRKLGFRFEERPFVSEYARSDTYMRIEL